MLLCPRGFGAITFGWLLTRLVSKRELDCDQRDCNPLTFDGDCSSFAERAAEALAGCWDVRVGKRVNWPYAMTQMQLQTITELKVKDGQNFEVVTEAPQESGSKVYLLDGEVLEWHAGNRATRLMVGMGSGRETAKIHYWLTDSVSGKKVFEHTDTIRQAFWANAYANSVGQLAQPFADKIADRIKEAKLG